MDIDVVWVLKDNALVIGVIASIILGTTGLWYKIKHDRDERRRKDRERRENAQSALKRMYYELKDTFDAIKTDQGIHHYRDCKNRQPVSFLLVKFWYTECENLIQLPEVRGADIDINKIKDIVGMIKEHDRIFDWMKYNLPPVDKYGSGSHIDDGRFPKVLENCRKMHRHQEWLRKEIPPTLQKIKEACNQLD